MSRPYNPKKVAGIVVILVLFVYGITKLFGSGDSDSFTPEEINSILQNKEEDIVKLKKVELTAQSLKVPFLEDSSYKVKNWDVSGNTMVKNHQYIRLTSDIQQQAGNMFSSKPIQAESFEMELTFHIHSKNTQLVADGFGIWFLDSKSDIGDVFGVKNFFKGLGIMIDTYKNGKRGQFPYVNLMLGDGNKEYSKWDDGYSTRLAGCNVQSVLNPSKGFTKARIVYIKNGYFSLDFNFDGKAEHWTNCVTLTDVILPPIKYLGFSAETGQVTENVDVIENKMYALYKPDGTFISSIDELQSLIQQQEENDSILKEELNEPGPEKNRRKTRKSLRRLQKAEQRIKERERKRRLEKYGREDMNGVKSALHKLVAFIKYCIYLFIAVILLWFVYIVLRVLRQKKRTKTTGLLD